MMNQKCNQVVTSTIESVNIPETHLSEFIWKTSLEKYPDRSAIVDGIDGTFYTFQQCWDYSVKFGSALTKIGIGRGDIVTIFLPNSLAYPIAVTGIIGIGAICTTQNPLYTPDEIAKQLKLSESRVIITMSKFLPSINEAIQKFELKNLEIILVDKVSKNSSYHNFYEMIENDEGQDFPKEFIAGKNYQPDDVALVLYSSGTTGPPKGVELTHRAMIANLCQLIYPKNFTLIEESDENHQSCTLGVLPFFHVFGMALSFMKTIHMGGKIVVLPKFDPKTFMEVLRQYKPTFLHLVPPLASFLSSNPNVILEDLQSVRRVLIGAAPLGPELFKKLKEKAPQMAIREGYGMTECQVCLLTPDNEIKAGSCGTLVSNNQAKIIDVDTGESLGPNKVGELCIKGPQNMKGYKNNAEATNKTIDSDDWLHTGDMAYYDEQDFFYIVDRLKELIKVNALQVSPAELEDVLRGHPDIADVSVIGIPDSKYGEVPKAFVVLKADNSDEEIVISSIHEYMKTRLSTFKQLKGGIEFIDKIPKSATGKILKRLLK